MSLVWSASPSTVYTELTATYTFKDDDVRAVYIDWDDGPSNKLSEANYEWKQYTEPVQSGTATHTYTASGVFNPVVRTINSQGIVSRFYANNDESANLTPFTQDATITGTTISDSEATGIMRVENRTVKSGIDNSIFEKEGSKLLYLFAPPLCTKAQLTSIDSVTVEVECMVDYSMVATGTAATDVGGTGQSLITTSLEISGTSLRDAKGVNVFTSGLTGGLISKVLKVTFTNPKLTSGYTDYDANDAYNFLKLFLVVLGDDGNYYPITYVSAGSPVKKANDPLRNSTLDFSQSRAAASNVDVSKFRYDNGKVWFEPANQWAITGTNFFDDDTVQTSPTKQVAYTYMARPDGLNGVDTVAYTLFDTGNGTDWARDGVATNTQAFRTDQCVIDDYGRFKPQYHLTRMSVQPSSATNGIDTEVSSLVSNKPEVYRITPTILSTMSAATSGGATKLDIAPLASGNYTADYTEAAFNQGSTNLVSLSGANTQTFHDLGGGTRTDHEYILTLWDGKTNKIGLNISNYANGLIGRTLSGSAMTAGAQYNIGISYLAIDNSGTAKQHAYWKEVEFEDTTKPTIELRNTGTLAYDTEQNSLSQSGYLSFDMPLDWSAISLTNLCGGQYDTAMTTSTSGALDIKITGTATNNAGASAEFGSTISLASLTGEEVTGGVIDIGTFGTADDIGAFKYMAYIVDTGSSTAANCENKPLWVANGTGNGTNAARTILYLTYGEDDTSYAPSNLNSNTDVEVLIRRVNIYDVFNGVSKVEQGDGTSATDLVPVDAQNTAFPSTYVISNPAGTFGAAVTGAWKTTDKYPLKITVSGSGTADGGGSGIKSFPEIWNVFDATEGNVSFIQEIDDSAYNLNSFPVTSDLAVTRAGNYYQAITRKGKVFIARTGIPIQSISFGSVAMGDETSATAFVDHGPDTLYGHLHKLRTIQADSVRVYWDEVQKDGTFVRFWGIITDVAETASSGGPRRIVNYSFNMIVEEIALIEADGKLMTDIFPLGGAMDERDFT